MIHDADLFWAFQPSADRLTPDTMHNTGKYHTHAHTATPNWGLEREGGWRGQWWRWSRQRLVPFHVKSRCWCTTRDAGVYFTRRPLVRRQIQYTTRGETSARGGKWCGCVDESSCGDTTPRSRAFTRRDCPVLLQLPCPLHVAHILAPCMPWDRAVGVGDSSPRFASCATP